MAIGLVILTLSVYTQVRNHEFVNFDDDVHVYENPFVYGGLTLENVMWAFKIHGPSQWHPLAWLSHQLDCELFGLWPGGHHLSNLVFHVASVVLLFLVLAGMTGSAWPSAFVASVFAVHPLNVESVTWISERRNVLSMFLGFLTVAAYYWYVRKGGLIRYTFVLFVFALGLMAKPLLVTLPCVLLLLDYWPLQRLAGGLGRVSKMSPGTQSPKLRRGSRSAGFMILEKVPLLILSAVSSVLTIWCQQSAGVVASTDTLSLPVRVLNALAVYTIYLRKIVWPSDLGVFYPHPGFVTLDPYAELLLQALAGTILLLAVTIWACLRVRQYPYLAVGWFWYLGTLFPMIGLLQVGEQQMADRYVYFPLVGLMIATAWLVPAIVPTRFHRRYLLRYAGVLAIVICTIFSWKQIAYWQNSVTLFEHTLAVTEHNSWAHNNLGLALHQGGKSFEARVQFREALKIDPKYALAYYNLGVVWHDLGRSDRAIPRFEEALRRRPGYVDAHLRLGIALADMEHFEDAILHFQQAVKLAPENLAAHFNLGLILLERGQQERAVRHFREALRIEPHYTEAQKNLQKALAP